MKSFVLVAMACVMLAGRGVRAGEVDLPRFAAVSPDGATVVFSWRGDLWRASTAGGEATRLTAHPADETRSAFSPDGSLIAFESNRSGRRAIHVMRADGSEVRQISFEDASLTLTGFSADGKFVLVSGSVEGDIYRAERPYRVSVEGGPIERLHGAFGQAAAGHADGHRYVFERGGSSWLRRHYRGPDNRNLWLFDARDGSFVQLTRWAGNDGQPMWRGAEEILYLSDLGSGERGTVGLWSMSLAAGERAAVRIADAGERDITGFDVSRDGSTVAYTAWDGLYVARFGAAGLGEAKRLTLAASADVQPKRESRDVSGEVSEAVLSPDGKVMAFVAFGDVFVRAIAEGSPTRQVTEGMARERDVTWSPDMSRLYFVSDREGSDSIYAATVSLTRKEVRQRFASATKVEEAKVEEKVEEAMPEASEAAVEAPAAEAEGGDAEQAAVSEPEAEAGKSEKKEEKKEDKPKVAERWADAMRFEIVPVVVEETDDRIAAVGPDGKSMLVRRTRGDVVRVDLISGEQTLMLESWDWGVDVRISSCGRYVAYAVNDADFNTDIFVGPMDRSWEAVNITRHPDNDVSPRWSHDSKILAFLSEREGDGYDVYTVMLDRALDAQTAQEREQYFKDRVEATKKLTVIDAVDFGGEGKADGEEKKDEVEQPFSQEDLADAYRRLERVTRYAGSESNLEITPAGDRLIFRAAGGAGGTSGVYSTKLDGSDEKRLATTASVQHVSVNGSKVVLLGGGRASTIAPGGGSEERIGIEARIELDQEQLSLQKFGEMARTLGRTFYHPTMKGLDWAGLSAEYAALARRAVTNSEFAEIGNRLMGELNGSHLGIIGGPEYSNPDFQAAGKLGVDATPMVRARADGGEQRVFRIDAVLPRLRTSAGEMRLMAGDVITGIELEEFGLRDTLDLRLAGRGGVETIVSVEREVGGEVKALDLLVMPVSLGQERAMRYDHWQLSLAKKVEERSGGRIGYLHIRSMGAPDLVEFERDLFAAASGKDGLIVDVRSNGGGWTADRVMAALTYTEHALTLPRGADPVKGLGYPRDRLFIQRYTGPVNMLCNEKSFSNAEIVSHAFKTLRRGTLVGQQTYGGVISTGAFTLVDGTVIRQPFRGWYLPDGTDMENNGAMPDVVVEQRPEDEAAGIDRQLDAAVDDLLKRIGG